jgi:DNA-binding NtrC family response regulator
VVFGGDPITAADLALPLDPGTERSGPLLQATTLPPLTLKELRLRCEREYILHVLAREGWNLSSAARALGLQRTYLHAKLAALGISRPR